MSKINEDKKYKEDTLFQRPILRLKFTKNIYKHYIKKGKSLNIFGARGVGKSRFIDDLKLLVDDNTHFITLNMRELRTDYHKFMDRLGKELNIDNRSNTISLLLDNFARKKGKKVLVIEHFEYLFEENHDKAFNFDFFDQLNSFKNGENISLLILSTLNYKFYRFYKDDELTTSPLDIDVMEITPLMHEEIESELRRNIDKDLCFKLLATSIMGETHPYLFIKFIIREVAFGRYNSNYSLEKNFYRWKEQFKKENNIPIIIKAKSNIKKWNFFAFGEFIIKVIKEWKKD